LLAVQQAQIVLVHQSRRLQGLPRSFLGQFLRCQLAQLLINEGQELAGGVGVALLDGRQDASDLVHGNQRQKKKPTRENTLGYSATSAYSLTSPPVEAGLHYT